jgi:hypothetical protein
MYVDVKMFRDQWRVRVKAGMNLAVSIKWWEVLE